MSSYEEAVARFGRTHLGRKIIRVRMGEKTAHPTHCLEIEVETDTPPSGRKTVKVISPFKMGVFDIDEAAKVADGADVQSMVGERFWGMEVRIHIVKEDFKLPVPVMTVTLYTDKREIETIWMCIRPRDEYWVNSRYDDYEIRKALTATDSDGNMAVSDTSARILSRIAPSISDGFVIIPASLIADRTATGVFFTDLL